jgi:hypothetical protein
LALLAFENANIIDLHTLRELAAAVGVSGKTAANGYVENKEKLLLEFTHGGRCNSDSIELLTVQKPPDGVAVPFDTEYVELASRGSAVELS